jgi:hypothetical protein
MSRTATRAGRALGVVLVVAALGWAGVRGASALLNAQERNPSAAFATTALYAPSGLTASYAGTRTTLSWPSGTNGSGYTVLGAANGTSNDCSAATFTTLTTTSALTVTDTRATPAGNWYCYQVQTAYGSWTSVQSNPTATVQLGFVTSSVSISNNSNNGKVDSGDQIAITFNQPVDPTTGPGASDGICTTTTLVLLGTNTGSTSCSATEAITVGMFSGGSSTINARFAATWAWSNGNRTLTATVGSRLVGAGNTFVNGPWTFNPVTTSTKFLATTGGAHVCDTNAGGGNCLPTAAGSF